MKIKSDDPKDRTSTEPKWSDKQTVSFVSSVLLGFDFNWFLFPSRESWFSWAVRLFNLFYFRSRRLYVVSPVNFFYVVPLPSIASLQSSVSQVFWFIHVSPIALVLGLVGLCLVPRVSSLVGLIRLMRLQCHGCFRMSLIWFHQASISRVYEGVSIGLHGFRSFGLWFDGPSLSFALLELQSTAMSPFRKLHSNFNLYLSYDGW